MQQKQNYIENAGELNLQGQGTIIKEKNAWERRNRTPPRPCVIRQGK